MKEEHFRRLKKIARDQNVSLSELIRRCMVQYLEEAAKEAPARAELYARASSLAGAFEDRKGATDVSAEHDRYLDEAFR
jgi:hypothetical protein